MLTLARGSRRAQQSDPLPVVFPSLEQAGLRPRFGQVTMIAAQPNAGKSMFALKMAVDWVKNHGLWGYYLSADTDEGDCRRRTLAMLTGMTMDEVEEELDGPGADYYLGELDSLCDLRWAFRSDPDVQFIMAELDAFHEVYGAHPDFLVVDNLVNLVGDVENDKRGLMELQMALKFFARTHGMAVLVLHHCSESSGDPTAPPARKWVQNKVSELPEQILTVAYDADQAKFGVAGVKLRGAKADPKAENPVWLEADFSRCHFGEPKVTPSMPTQRATSEWWKDLDGNS